MFNVIGNLAKRLILLYLDPSDIRNLISIDKCTENSCSIELITEDPIFWEDYLKFTLELNCTFSIINTLCYHAPYKHLQPPIELLEKFHREFISYCLTRYKNVVYTAEVMKLSASNYFAYLGGIAIAILTNEPDRMIMWFDLEHCWAHNPEHGFQYFDNIHEIMPLLFSEIHKAFTA